MKNEIIPQLMITVKKRGHLALLCLLTDLALALWSYFSLTNYEEYMKTIKPMISSPDFQLQIYQVLLQTLTFSLALFLFFHLVIYVLYWKGKSAATKYVYYYSFMAALSCLLMLGSKLYFALFPLLIYCFVFSETKKIIKKIVPSS